MIRVFEFRAKLPIRSGLEVESPRCGSPKITNDNGSEFGKNYASYRGHCERLTFEDIVNTDSFARYFPGFLIPSELLTLTYC